MHPKFWGRFVSHTPTPVRHADGAKVMLQVSLIDIVSCKRPEKMQQKRNVILRFGMCRRLWAVAEYHSNMFQF